uniref:PAP-specific phosphatase, mitochondrial n=1 Tax=Zea mays TaxID=4577 RepID=B6TCT0_MAIZE|nr:hypothetical protein [Zea mays]
MPLLHLSLPSHRLLVGGRGRLFFPSSPRRICLSVRAAGDAAVSVAEGAYGLPFRPEGAAHHRELSAAVAVVERACRLCVDVKRSLFSRRSSILEKNDQSPVTVADFGVQALISLELQRLFPSIPLVAEEDSASLRSSKADDNSSDILVESIFSAVVDKVSNNGSHLTQDDVLRAIDRGGKDAVSFDSNPATYWVGLALVVNGKVTVGVMGCPNWTNDDIVNKKDDSVAACNGRGILMVSHIGCGTWSRRLSADIGQFNTAQDIWKRCFVDTCSIAHMAHYCIPDSQTWDMIPLSATYDSTTDATDPRNENEILLLSVFCGSLCKYLTIASGRASVFVLQALPTTQIKSWDHAVGVICVQEAGGQTSDWSGEPLDLAADLTSRRIIYPRGGVLVTNGALHDKLVEMISASYK